MIQSTLGRLECILLRGRKILDGDMTVKTEIGCDWKTEAISQRAQAASKKLQKTRKGVFHWSLENKGRLPVPTPEVCNNTSMRAEPLTPWRFTPRATWNPALLPSEAKGTRGPFTTTLCFRGWALPWTSLRNLPFRSAAPPLPFCRPTSLCNTPPRVFSMPGYLWFRLLNQEAFNIDSPSWKTLLVFFDRPPASNQ